MTEDMYLCTLHDLNWLPTTTEYYPKLPLSGPEWADVKGTLVTWSWWPQAPDLVHRRGRRQGAREERLQQCRKWGHLLHETRLEDILWFPCMMVTQSLLCTELLREQKYQFPILTLLWIWVSWNNSSPNLINLRIRLSHIHNSLIMVQATDLCQERPQQKIILRWWWSIFCQNIWEVSMISSNQS